MKPFIIVLYISTLIVLTVFSYGFIDPNLSLSTNPILIRFIEPLTFLVYHKRPIATILFFIILIILYIYYVLFLYNPKYGISSMEKLRKVLLASATVLIFSYQALSYDLFNYITTAKVLFRYHENPYIVIPVEIPNDPNLLFTRAANKTALYGPVWLAITAIPHYLGSGNIWLTIIAYKGMNAVVFLLFAYMVYHVTKSITNVLFFALNPLVIMETLVSGHNDIFMMILALAGLVLWKNKLVINNIIGWLLFIASWFIKGATVVLLPVFILRKLSLHYSLFIAYFLLLIVILAIAPIREELYPWYAVWIVSVMSLLPIDKHQFLTNLTIIFTFSLELRHLPYMWMGYYAGVGPGLRSLFIVIPVFVYLVVYGIIGVIKKSS